MVICFECGYKDCKPGKKVIISFGNDEPKVEETFFQCPNCGQSFTRRVKEGF